MTKWTIGFEATVKVDVEADTEADAIRAAGEGLKAPFPQNGAEVSVEEVYLVVNIDTREEFFK